MAISPITIPKGGKVNRVQKLQINKKVKLTPAFITRAKIIIPRMMGEGAFIEEVIAELDISKETLYAWCGENQEISDCVAKGRRLFEAWWIRNGRDGMGSNNFNANQYKWMTMNGLNWSQNSKTETKVEVAETIQGAAQARIKMFEEATKEIEHE